MIGGTEGNHENHIRGQHMARSRFESVTSAIETRSVKACFLRLTVRSTPSMTVRLTRFLLKLIDGIITSLRTGKQRIINTWYLVLI
jgi:hypothetical protein